MSLYRHLLRKKQGYNLLFCYSSNDDHIGGINEMITNPAFKSRIPGNAELQLGIKRGYSEKQGLTELLSKVYVVMRLPPAQISACQAFKSRKRQ